MGDLKPGIIVQLPELKPSSQYYKAQQSLRILGLLESYSVQTAMAVITHGGAKFRVDTQHLRNLEMRIGSLYQFIGELLPDPEFPSQLMLQARVGRNVDGLDLDLYDKALQIRRQFEQKYLREASASSSYTRP
ncbi:unnamed protein product [Calypogeia fissa]